MMKTNSLGIYIHVPFCKNKCPYCDFYSVKLKADAKVGGVSTKVTESAENVVTNDTKTTENCAIVPFGASCLQEIDDFFSTKWLKQPIDTVYFGGGSPNLLDLGQISEILKQIYEGCGHNGTKNMAFSVHSDQLEKEQVDIIHAGGAESSASANYPIELTIEVNPKQVDLEYLKGLKELGFNRLSMGMQSFDDEVLRKIGRGHDAQGNIDTFYDAREAGFDNISIDLMFGIPGQSFESWKETVKRAIELNPEHISLYSLEFMEGTPFTKMLEDGRLKETDPEEDREMYHYALDEFEKAGFKQYEISNVAKPGFESKHNLKYWNLEEYIGFGPSAHSFYQGRRFANPADLDAYITDPLFKNIYEENTVFDSMSEYVFTGLRKNEGIDLNEFRMRFGMDIWAAFEFSQPMFMQFVESGHAELTNDHMRLTRKGFDISNQILCLFV